MKNTIIPKKETRTKRLFIPVTPTEHLKIKRFCSERQVKFSDFVRFALQETYDF